VTTYAEALVGEGVDQPSDLAELNDGDWPESIKTLHRKKIKAAVAKGGFDLPEPEGAMGQDDKVSPTRPGTNADVDTEELELAEAIQRSLNMARVETNVQEDVELGLEPSAARVETETNAQQAEELTLGQTLRVALETNRNMARVHPEERMAAARAESSHIDLAEPPLKTPEDFGLWYAWAKEHTDQHRRMVHPREYDQRGRPSDKPLSLWTSRREIGRQFGAGVELYLELLDLCLKGCLLGAAVYAYSLYLNLEQGLSMEVMDGFTGEVRIATPFTSCAPNPHTKRSPHPPMCSFLARLHPTLNRPTCHRRRWCLLTRPSSIGCSTRRRAAYILHMQHACLYHIVTTRRASGARCRCSSHRPRQARASTATTTTAASPTPSPP